MSDHATTTDSMDADDLGGIQVEPDEVPTRWLAWLGVGITVAVVVIVIFVYFLFEWTVDAELRAKGYADEGAVPARGVEEAAP